MSIIIKLDMMFTVPNFLSLLRLPLACVFFQEDPVYRALAIAIACLTDVLDGFIARRYGQTSRMGTLLDPFTDKLFVFTALAVFFFENRLGYGEIIAFLCRDFSVLLFSVYLFSVGEFKKYRVGAIWTGKLTTAIQFPALIALAMGVTVNLTVFCFMAAFGLLAFPELYLEAKRQRLHALSVMKD